MDAINRVKGTFDAHPRIKKNAVPSPAAVRRLPLYRRCLWELLGAGILRVSSSELAARTGIPASRIRQDLSCFGDFGQQGYGYNTKYLFHKIDAFFGDAACRTAVLFGAGAQGRAALGTRLFEAEGVRCAAVFDTAPATVGGDLDGFAVRDAETLPAYCRAEGITLAVLATTPDAAPDAYRRLTAAGIRGILNISGATLPAREREVIVYNIHPADTLMALCFEVSGANQGEEEQP